MVIELGTDVDPHRPAPSFDDVAQFCAPARTHLGTIERLRWPGVMNGVEPLLGYADNIGAGSATWRKLGYLDGE